VHQASTVLQTHLLRETVLTYIGRFKSLSVTKNVRLQTYDASKNAISDIPLTNDGEQWSGSS